VASLHPKQGIGQGWSWEFGNRPHRGAHARQRGANNVTAGFSARLQTYKDTIIAIFRNRLEGELMDCQVIHTVGLSVVL